MGFWTPKHGHLFGLCKHVTSPENSLLSCIYYLGFLLYRSCSWKLFISVISYFLKINATAPFCKPNFLLGVFLYMGVWFLGCNFFFYTLSKWNHWIDVLKAKKLRFLKKPLKSVTETPQMSIKMLCTKNLNLAIRFGYNLRFKKWLLDFALSKKCGREKSRR